MQSTKLKDDNMEEKQYLDLISDILYNGSLDEGRNGKVLSVFGKTMRFSLQNNTIPILTTKKVAWKTCLKELLWFIKGQTNNKILQEQNVKIWNANASREFLDSRNLHHLQENDLGPIYGHQWRHFNAEYKDCNTDYIDKGIDQLQYIIDNLKDEKNRYSRRLVMSAWNPCQLDEMALPPCHILVQFNVSYGNKLSCALYQRSGDVGLGVPFNIASYAFLTHLIAKHCNLESYEFIHNIGNAHIYKDHISALSEQKNRKTCNFPKINIKNIYNNINDYKIDDFEIIDYIYNGPVQMKMIA
jgi:thymidylate synthase